ncbi:DUF2795 domain-containing protein [Comamonas sp. JC664]|uniref:DUF2795 domain-containing protein n=1 Tax=Comamonas sp. JC664 TaxID=2801917 RepID=UPI00174C4FCA|nr:DUF2795 domain-containing protein [Comamonas sp. JC664]MBL0692725.1 DUF2795 domain-containing protein [Comamonas sp. JC664]GHG93492.1 hypothetical protein GCM10012319_55930 [Comamonas sp. KCTC 72670]
MAYGLAEDPALSITPHLDAVEYPVEREQLVMAAADAGAPPDVINLFKCLPRPEYATREAVMRDLAEAARRSALGGLKDDDGVNRDRRNIGRDLVENAPDGQTRHP